jgi:hypothetical protein
MTDCQICYDTFNGSTRKKCVCPYCSVGYCRECVGTWLTTLVDEPRCPNETCKKAWSREFIDTIVTKVWRDSVYREYRERLLMDRERALLPATQPRIEAINEAKRLEKEVIGPMRDRRKEIQVLIWDMTNHAERLRNGVGVDEAAAKQRNVFIRRCPADGCRGFLSSAWKCGVCELYSCPDCQEVKGVARDSAHTCDPGALETAKLISKDTKGCPKCGEMITKIDGCDQMWCVSCHTAFSWRTGQVATGIVHNPHYYEFQRRMNNGAAPRNAGDIPCGGLVDWTVLRRAILPVAATRTAYPAWVSTLELAHRRINHVQNVDMPHLAANAVNINDNIDLRIGYLLKEYTDVQMMAVLQIREKKREKELETRRVYETFTGAAADIFRRMVAVSEERGRDPENFKPLLNELDQLRLFINDALDVLRRRYSCTLHGFDNNWERLTLKMNKVKAGDESKTIYGLFANELTKFEAEFAGIKAPAVGEDSRAWARPWLAKVRKLERLVRTFPSDPVTIRYANAALSFYENSIKALEYSEGTDKSDYYQRLYEQNRNTARTDFDKWKTHVLTLELTNVKPTNAIV